jgi:hypothetical protein
VLERTPLDAVVVRQDCVELAVRTPEGVQVSKEVELPLDSWWYPTAGVPGWACGHARQPRQTPSRGGSRA